MVSFTVNNYDNMNSQKYITFSCYAPAINNLPLSGWLFLTFGSMITLRYILYFIQTCDHSKSSFDYGKKIYKMIFESTILDIKLIKYDKLSLQQFS